MIKELLSKSVLGICAWDLPALIVLIVLLVVFLVHRHKLKKYESELEDELSDLLAEGMVETVQEPEVN